MSRPARRVAAVAAVVAAALAGPAASAAVRYTITTFAPFAGGYNGFAYALNAKGQVTGEAETAPSGAGYDAYLGTASGSQQDLGNLGGAFSVGYGINAAGQVVGQSRATAGGLYSAFLYSNGQMSALALPNASDSYARAINDAGQITGDFDYNGTSVYHAFLTASTDATTARDLGLLAGYTSAAGYGVNATGLAVGVAYNPYTVQQRAVEFVNGTVVDLGALVAKGYSAADAVNAAGTVVGSSTYTTTNTRLSHAFARAAGATAMTDLGTLGGTSSSASGINDAGTIVGTSYLASGASDAFIYANGTMTDLNTLIDPSYGAVLDQAYAINNAGQIAGDAQYKGEIYGFLLTPVPEPTLAAVALAAPLLGRRRRRVV